MSLRIRLSSADIRDLRARNEAKRSYRKFADDLWALSKWCYAHGWFEAMTWATDHALIAENAAWAEDMNPEVAA